MSIFCTGWWYRLSVPAFSLQIEGKERDKSWTIVMGVFDAAQSVVASASGLIIGDTSINISSVMVGIEDRLMEMELGRWSAYGSSRCSWALPCGR